jgi:hypothetical protein
MVETKSSRFVARTRMGFSNKVLISIEIDVFDFYETQLQPSN